MQLARLVFKYTYIEYIFDVCLHYVKVYSFSSFFSPKKGKNILLFKKVIVLLTICCQYDILMIDKIFYALEYYESVITS